MMMFWHCPRNQPFFYWDYISRLVAFWILWKGFEITCRVYTPSMVVSSFLANLKYFMFKMLLIERDPKTPPQSEDKRNPPCLTSKFLSGRFTDKGTWSLLENKITILVWSETLNPLKMSHTLTCVYYNFDVFDRMHNGTWSLLENKITILVWSKTLNPLKTSCLFCCC